MRNAIQKNPSQNYRIKKALISFPAIENLRFSRRLSENWWRFNVSKGDWKAANKTE